MTNAIAISRGFVESGVEQKAANAIAEAIVSHADENHATKADFARLEGKLTGDITRLEDKLTGDITHLEDKLTAEIAGVKNDLASVKKDLTGDNTRLDDKLTGKIEATTAQNKMLIALAVGIYVGLAMLFINGLAG